MSGHYSISRFASMDEVRKQFSDQPYWPLNWLLVGTSGVHGSYASLDDAQACYDGTCDCDPAEQDEDGHVPPSITVLKIQPRLVALTYGHVTVTPDDIAWLREAVRHTLEAIRESQKGSHERR